MIQGPLVLVDDDAEDQEMMLLALRELGFQHEIKLFSNAEDALNFLYGSSDRPFMIVSDINMPKMDGIVFKKTIEKCNILRSKCIPFIFFSTSTKYISQTCDLNIQGYFEKSSTWSSLHETMKVIISYWKRTKHIN